MLNRPLNYLFRLDATYCPKTWGFCRCFDYVFCVTMLPNIGIHFGCAPVECVFMYGKEQIDACACVSPAMASCLAFRPSLA